jgi:PAS domain S-box-containing protein
MHSIVRFSDAVLVEVNETFTRTLGYTRDEVIGKTPFELKFWMAPERLHGYREQLETKGFVRDFEVELRAKDGSLRTVLLSSEVVDIDGEAYSLSAGVDISERKRSEKIQQATYQISEAAHATGDLGSLYAHIHGIIKGLMPADNFYIALFDPATESISFPYFVDERSEKPEPFRLDTGLTGYVLRASKPLLVDAAMNARKQRVGDKVTFKGFKEIRYVESGEPAATWLGVPLSVQGKSIGVMAVQDYRDGQAYGEEEKRILAFVATQTALAIERKRAQQALRESEQKFRALFEGSSQGVMIHDEEKFLEVNSATLRMLGFASAGEVLGKHPKDTAPPFQPDGESSEAASLRHIAECMEKGSARFDWVGLNANGEQMPFEVILTRVELSGRKVIQAVINDISERKKAETELQNALSKERELSQLKSDFVSLVSHEFRTPLEIIMSSADNLERYHERLAPEKRDQLLRTIRKSVRRMSGMMEEVLVLGRLETERMTFKPAVFEFRSFCQRICDEIESATGKRCPIHLQMNGTPENATGDESLLRHIFTNLLSNAVKYSPPDRPVDFLVHREIDKAICRVTDHGCGIPEADQKRLFQAFHRGSNVRHIPGTGLGLLIVQRCVALHSGEIQFESVEGQGTTFTVRIPLFLVGADVRRL